MGFSLARSTNSFGTVSPGPASVRPSRRNAFTAELGRRDLSQYLAVRCRGLLATAGTCDPSAAVLPGLAGGHRRTGHLPRQVTHTASLATNGLSRDRQVSLAAHGRTADLSGQIPDATLRNRSQLLRLDFRGHGHCEHHYDKRR